MNIDFYEMICQRILEQPDLSASSRGMLYRRIIAATNAYFARRGPEASALELRQVLKLIDDAIKKIEAEFLAAREAGLGEPEWTKPPPPPPTVSSPSDPSAGAVEAVAVEAAVSAPGDNWDEHVESAVERMQSRRFGFLRSIRAQLRITGALLWHYASTAAGAEPMSFLWLAVEPIVQVVLVISLYYAFGHTIIYSMPALPFAIIGVCAWLMFRACFLKIGTGLGREFTLCYLPGVTRFDVALAKSLFYFLTYLLSSTLMLLMLWIADVQSAEVKNPEGYLFLWVLLWIFSLSFGLVSSYAIYSFPTIKRLLLLVVRMLYLFSGAAMVTEQLPSQAKIYLLWNPLVHGFQLLRSAYFYSYKSEDADPVFFMTSLIFLLFAGVIAERAQRRFELKP